MLDTKQRICVHLVTKSNIGSNFRRFVVPSFSAGLGSADHPLLSVAQWPDVPLFAGHSGLLLAVLDVVVLLGFLGTSLHLELVGRLWLEMVDLLLSWDGKADGLVHMEHPLLGVAQWPDVPLVADLFGLLLAVRDIVVLLDSFGMGPHLELTDLLRLETIYLLLSWKGEAFGALLPSPVRIGLAHLWSHSPTLVPTSISFWLINAIHPFMSITQKLDFPLVADLSGLLFAVLDVAILLSSLGMSLHLKLIDFLRFETISLLLSWKNEAIGEPLPFPVYVSLALFNLGFSGGFVYSHVNQSPENYPVVASFYNLVNPGQFLLVVLEAFLLALFVDLFGLLLTVLDVTVLPGPLETHFYLDLVSILRLELAVLFLS